MPDALQTTNTVHTALHTGQGWFGSGIGGSSLHAHVEKAARALADPQLSPADANKSVQSLAQSGDLDRLASDVVAGGNVLPGTGGLSTSERQQFMATMAAKLDGASLAKLSDAFAKADPATGGDQYVRELADAVAAHAGPQVKVDYIRAIAPSATDLPLSSRGTSTTYGDPEAAAIGTVLGSLSGAHAHDAAAVLSPEQRTAVLTASVNATMDSSSAESGSVVLSYDAKPFDRVMTAIASTNDPKMKADYFAAGAAQLKEVRDTGPSLGLITYGQDAAQKTIAQGMGRLIDSETAGVMNHLAYDRATFNGSALATYAKQMLTSGGEKHLGEILAKLRAGNDLQDNPAQLFERTTTVASGKPTAQNAGALGNFVGAVYSAAASISSDVRAQQDMTTAVLKSALTIIDKARIGGIAGGTAASVAKEWVAYAVRAAIKDPGNSAATRLEIAAMPIDPKTDRIGVGMASTGEFGAKIAQVQRLAKP